MNDNSYIVVMGWMLSKLGLSGNDLLAYALIYSYSQDAQGCYFGSLSHTAERLNISRRAAVDVLNRLIDKGHITKQNIEIDGVMRCMYKAVVPKDMRTGEPPTAPPVKHKPTTAQSKPTLEEVKAYCAMRGNKVDAAKFYDFYEANGWVQGRNKPIKDWRAAVRTWERTENFNQYGKDNKSTVLAQRRCELADEIAQLDAEYRARKAAENDSGGFHGFL